MGFEEELEIQIGFDRAGTSSFLDWFQGRLTELQNSVAAGGDEAYGAGALAQSYEKAIAGAEARLAELGVQASTLIEQINTIGSGHTRAVDGYIDAERAGAATTVAPATSGSLAVAESEAAAKTRIAAEARVVEATKALEASAAEDEAKAGSQTYKDATVRAATARLEVASAEAGAKAESEKYLDATVNAAIKRNEQTVAEAAQAAASDDLLKSTVAEAIARNASAAILDAALADSELYRESVALAAAALRLRAAADMQAKADSPIYRESVDAELQAKLALKHAEEDATAATRAQEDAALALAKAAREAAVGDTAAATGAAAGGAAEGGVAAGAAAGAASGGGLLSSFGSLAPLLAGFSIYRQIREGIKDATDLEKVLAVTQVQMEDLGKGAEFGQFKQGILDISTATGVAGAQVAQTAQQFQAAFGGNTVQALTETRNAMEAVRVTGLSLKDVVNVFLALQQSFAGITVSEISDKALGLQQRTGTPAAETLKFASQIAPLTSELGFSASDVEALGAVIEKVSGKGAQANADSLSRVFASMQTNAVKLVEFLQANAPKIATAVASSLGAGDIRGAFETLLANYDNLTKAQQQNLLATLAKARDEGTLAAAFTNSGQVLDELKGKYDDTGKTQQTYTRIQDTLQQQVAQLGAAFQKLGVDVYDAGLKEVLGGIAAGITGVVHAADGIASVFATLNDVTHGWVGQLALLLAALQAIEFLADTRLFAKLLGGLGFSTLGGASIAATTAASAESGVGLAEASGLGALLAKLNPLNALKGGVVAASAEGTGLTTFGGGGIAASLKAGFAGAVEAAGPGLILAGALLANSIIGAVNQGFEENYSNDLKRRLGGKASIDNVDDIDKALAGRNNVGGGAIQTSRDLAKYLQNAPGTTHVSSFQDDLVNGIFGTDQGIDVSLKPSEVLDKAVRDHASGWQQWIDQIPGASQSNDITSNVQALHQSEDTQTAAVKGALEKLQGNDDLLKAFLKEVDKSGGFGGGSHSFLGANPQAKIQGILSSIAAAGGSYAKLSAEDQRDVSRLVGQLPDVDKAGGKVASGLKALQDKAAAQEQVAIDAATAKKNLDDGVIGLGEYLAQANKLQKALDAITQGGGAAGAAAQKESDANTRNIRQATSESLRRSVDFAAEARQIAGTDSPKADVDDLTALLNNPEFSDKKERLSATKALVAAIKKEKTYEASLTSDVKEKAAILNSKDALPEGAQEALVGEFLTYNETFQVFLANTLNGNIDLQNTISDLTAQAIANGVKNVRDATIIADRIELNTLRNALNATNIFSKANSHILSEIATVMAQLHTAENTSGQGLGGGLADAVGPGGKLAGITVPDFSQVGAADGSNKTAADSAAAKQAKEDALAALDVDAARAKGDAIRLAQIAQQRAQISHDLATTDAERSQALAAMITADQQLSDAILNHDKQLRDLFVAASGDDPIAAARAAVANAYEAISRANGPDESLAAQADLARAQKALANAIQAGMDAQFDLLIATDSAAGDTVKAAQDALGKLYTKLANADNLQLTQAERDEVMAQIIGASAGVRQAIISEGESSIQTDLTLKRITVSQAIAELEALKAKAISAGATQKEIDQIAIEIQNLKGSLGQDLKFNLPTILGLPNLYEAKRVDQTPGGGVTNGSYQDNRVVTVNINAQTNATAGQIGQAVSDAIGPTRSIGPRTRRY